ncbi:hypothetical protein ACRAWD_18640 [Caulobacter segnis]
MAAGGPARPAETTLLLVDREADDEAQARCAGPSPPATPNPAATASRSPPRPSC